MAAEQFVIKLKLSKPSPIGIENYQHLRQIWKGDQMNSFKHFLRWYNNKDIVPTLEAMQTLIAFSPRQRHRYVEAGFYITKPNQNFPHKFLNAKLYLFTEVAKHLLEETEEDVVGGPSIVFTRKAVVDETSIRKSRNICKSIVRIDANQLYHFLMCQPMPTDLHNCWDLDSET